MAVWLWCCSRVSIGPRNQASFALDLVINWVIVAAPVFVSWRCIQLYPLLPASCYDTYIMVLIENKPGVIAVKHGMCSPLRELPQKDNSNHLYVKTFKTNTSGCLYQCSIMTSKCQCSRWMPAGPSQREAVHIRTVLTADRSASFSLISAARRRRSHIGLCVL